MSRHEPPSLFAVVLLALGVVAVVMLFASAMRKPPAPSISLFEVQA